MLGLGTAVNRGGFVSGAAAAKLLDTYSSAAAAYSLRKLSNSYSGNAVKVRRASDDTELDIGFSSGELDTSALATHCGSSNGFVVTWYDQSGNSNNVTQSTAADQPKIYDATAERHITENGKPAIDFDGNDDFLNTTSSISASVSDYTIYFVENRTKSVDYGLDSSSGRLVLGNNQGAYHDTSFKGVGLTQGAQFSNGYFLLTAGSSISENGTITQSGLSYTQRAIKTSTSIYGHNNGSGRKVDGNLQELIIWTNDQSSNRTAIESDINAFYSIY